MVVEVPPLLELSGLAWQAHGTRRALAPDPLTVGPGRTAVVVAAGCAEADAFTDILVGLEMPDDGQIRIHGQEITMRLPAEREIGLIPAGAGLLPHLTVEQNLALTARDDQASPPIRGMVAYMAKKTDIQGFLRSRPHELAHDERLHVALARALCRRTAVKVMVVEDRTGCGPCHAAVSAALGTDPSLAVLVVTDDRTRVASLASPSRFWEIADAPDP
ncbi:ATP-binding cassette domain-containing protein [Nonomuraea angiospora]|uniref:ABC-type thiamine transport system ATPase subunit n=1 Tax=Nonomuraea angiospora TaxID=46172 RepID=A0ABR9MA14_9ACTN|nr:ATP-binding cassette domain-containing protein [Nonomuraea angiospora]MBE1589758.1 ABC-type thiamine transport system ATPase subunit [Nonomuraea angiospora]